MSSMTPALAKKLPTLIESRHLLTMLFGPDTVCALRKGPIPFEECAIVAAYSDNDGKVQRLLACDLAFANSAGAALSAIPPAVANKETKLGRFAENVLENLSEVMNIAVTVLKDSFGARLTLISTLQRNELTPEIIEAIKSSSKSKIDVTIPRYELGRIDLIAVEN